MSWFAGLKLKTKFNVILLSLLLFLLLVTSYLSFRDQQDLILKRALNEGRGVARQLIETTDYMSAHVRNEPEKNYALVPQVVATQIAKQISSEAHYQVRQISTNYRNPENRPDEYEAAQLKTFSTSPAREVYEVTGNQGDNVFRYMQAMVTEESCLKCHGPYESAPGFIQQRYPAEHPSYNYSVGQIAGAVSFSMPLADVYRDIGTNLRQDLIYRLIILILVFLTIGSLIRRYMIVPISMLSESIHRVTTTGNLSERITFDASRDEIGSLVKSFNEMMDQLDRTTMLREESEDRYRNLIDASQSAIVTFLKDGKIVLSNALAEQFLGRSRNGLLGESFFSFLEEGELLQQKIDSFSSSGDNQTIHLSLRNFSGKMQEVEVTLVLASLAENTPMYTAIIRANHASSSPL